MDMNDLAVAVNLGVSRCTTALVNRKGDLIRQHTAGLGKHGGETVGSIIAEQMEEMLAHAALKYLQVEGVGIAVHGMSDQKHGTVRIPHMEGWEKFPLQKYIKDHLTRHDLPVLVESAKGSSMMGEHWLGIARNTRNAVFISIGEEIGAGIMVDGNLVRGSYDLAGELGWMALQRPFKSKFKAEGNLNYFASEQGLIRTAGEYSSKSAGKLFQKGKSEKLSAADLIKSLEKKDPTAKKVIDQAIELWGMASANLVSIFNPEVIIFGGSLFGPGLQFLDRIYREAISWAQPTAMRQVKFVATVLKENAPLLGVACMVFNRSRE